jgi:hypothetical protein
LRAWLWSSSLLASMAVETCVVAMEVVYPIRRWTTRSDERSFDGGSGLEGAVAREEQRATQRPLHRRIHRCSSRGGAGVDLRAMASQGAG